VQLVSEEPCVERLPATSFVAHTYQICDEHVVMYLRVTGSRRRMAGYRPAKASCRRTQLCAPAPAALLLYDTVEVSHRGVTFGVEDNMHVLGSADNTKFCYRLVRADNQLHAGPHAVNEALARARVARTAGAEYGPPLGRVDSALEAQPGSAGTAPGHRRLAPRCVVILGVAHRVVLSAQDRPLVVADRVGAHHPHPRHRAAPSPPI
jgi:hypothetical protein